MTQEHGLGRLVGKVVDVYRSSYGSEYYTLQDEDGCTAKFRISDHPQKDHNRSEFGGVSYNLYRSRFASDDALADEIEKLLRRTHDKRHAPTKPPSRWIKPSVAQKEYNVTEAQLKELGPKLVWYKRNSPVRAAILRESLEKALGNRLRA